MKISKSDLKKLNEIKDKRPSTVIQHIIRFGSVTTEELENLYGYKHPPRAVRDVRERGVNLETFKTKSSDGRNIAAYRFGTPLFMENPLSKKVGRTALSSALKKALLEKYGSRCFIYNKDTDENSLQVDHRIPYEIGGNPADGDIEAYMLVSPSANRMKSWCCEHCQNWSDRDSKVCACCFFANPEGYDHIACRPEKHIIITFTGDEIEDYEKLIRRVGMQNAENTIKALLRDFLQ